MPLKRVCALPFGSRAVSSVVEHYLDMVGVTGSNPVPRTIPDELSFKSYKS